MARFQYRLQKVFDLRERRKKQQEQRVLDAQAQVKQVEDRIAAKHQEIRTLSDLMKTAPGSSLADYDRFIYKLRQDLDELHLERRYALDRLEVEKQLLQKAQSDLEALIKHKEKAIEEWKEEEKARELKQLDEVAGQRFFRQMAAAAEEDE
jgi:flagellar FliJ protein